MTLLLYLYEIDRSTLNLNQLLVKFIEKVELTV